MFVLKIILKIKDCGKSSYSNTLIASATGRQLKIVNGQDAVPYSLPSIVYIRIKNVVCAGTLIDAQTVMSAAQ